MKDAITNIWLIDRDIGDAIALLPWFPDGEPVPGEAAVVLNMANISAVDSSVLGPLLAQPWVADGVAVRKRGAWPFLRDAAESNPDLATALVGRPWFVDGIDDGENSVIEAMWSNLENNPGLASKFVDLPDVSPRLFGRYTVTNQVLIDIAQEDFPMAMRLAEYYEATSRDLAAYLIESIGQFIYHNPEDLEKLVAQPWFADDWTDEEAAFISTLFVQRFHSVELLDDLLDTRHSISRTLSSPLAGEVTIWVFQHEPFTRSSEELLDTMEDTVYWLEGFLEVPFPTSDIILLVVENGHPRHWIKQLHYGRHMRLYSYDGEVRNASHETAHYYFKGALFEPQWLREGASELTQTHVTIPDTEHGLAGYRDDLEARMERYCVASDREIENILHYDYRHERLREWFRFPGRCHYIMGENLLHNLYDILGESELGSALGELYLSARNYLDTFGEEERVGHEATDERIYQVLLQRAPPDRQGEFRALYRQLHGGPDGFRSTEHPLDDHGNDVDGATHVELNNPVGGVLDYPFDFDYFRFRAEEGGKYRILVAHQSLRRSSLGLFTADGITIEAQRTGRWKAREYTTSGLRILWQAPKSGDYYVAVENFGGKTGPYELTIESIVPRTDDHGDAVSSATRIAVGETVAGSIQDELDFDFFRFQAAEGRVYNLELVGDTLEHFRISPELPGADWPSDWLIEDLAWLRETSYSWEAPNTGEYYISVDGRYGSTGTYSFTVSQYE